MDVDLKAALSLPREALTDATNVLRLLRAYLAELVEGGFLEQDCRQRVLAMIALTRQLFDEADSARSEIDVLAARATSLVDQIFARGDEVVRRNYEDCEWHYRAMDALHHVMRQSATLSARLAAITREMQARKL